MDFKDLLEQSWKTFTEFLPAMLINTIVLLIVSFFTLGILYGCPPRWPECRRR